MVTVCQIGNFGPVNSTENDLLHALRVLDVSVYTVQEDAWIAGKATVPPPDGFDLLLWTRTWPVSETVAEAQLEPWRRAGVPLVGYHLDRWSGLRRAVDIWSDPYWSWLDWWFTADPALWMWDRLVPNTVWVPPAVSTRWLDDVQPDPDRWPYQVVFVGNHTSGYHPEHTHRPAMLDQLRRRYGRRFTVLPNEDRQIPQGQRIHPQDLSVLYATVPVVVGDSCLAGVDAYWSDRVPETIGRGGLLVHPDTNWMDEYAPGVHLLTFGAWDWDRMQAAIDLALDDPDLTGDIRKLGREHVLRWHTYTQRMQHMLETIL